MWTARGLWTERRAALPLGRCCGSRLLVDPTTQQGHSEAHTQAGAHVDPTEPFRDALSSAAEVGTRPTAVGVGAEITAQS